MSGRPRRSSTVRTSPCSLCTLLLMNLLDEDDVREDGTVSPNRKEAAERAYMLRTRAGNPSIDGAGMSASAHHSHESEVPEADVLVESADRCNESDIDCNDTSASSSPSLSCSVCLTRPKMFACVPCYHMCVCERCEPRIQACPICRGDILRMQRVFLT